MVSACPSVHWWTQPRSSHRPWRRRCATQARGVCWARRSRRADYPARVDGSARFGIDVDLPGMLVARAACPSFSATLAAVDDAASRAGEDRPGGQAAGGGGRGGQRLLERAPGCTAAAARMAGEAQVPVSIGALHGACSTAVSAGAGLAWPEPTESSKPTPPQRETARRIMTPPGDALWRMRRWNPLNRDHYVDARRRC